MRIPGFTAHAAVRTTTMRGGTASGGSPHRGSAPDNGRFVPQQFTCEEELGPVCWNNCRRSWDPQACYRRCLKEYCWGPYTGQGRR